MQILTKKSTLLSICLLIGLLGSSRAAATTVSACAPGTGGPTPGNTVFPIDCTGSTSGTLLADQDTPFSYSTTAGTNSGTIESAVYNDGGTLDFYYQITNSASSATALARMTATNFLGFSTFVTFLANGSTLVGTSFVDGTLSPITADSNANGSVIGFNFFPPTIPNPEIGPGSSSEVLVISTNATAFKAGNVTIIDGGSFAGSAFEPTSPAVPEPGSVVMLGLGIIGLAALRHFGCNYEVWRAVSGNVNQMI